MDKKSLKDTKTRENLMKAFAGESMARNRYDMFASVAEKEGFIQIANVFRATALNEKEHAEVYYKFLDGEDVQINNALYPTCYGDTKQNLQCAAKYEEEEHSLLYPEFGKIAQEEGFKEIAEAFFNIAKIESHHSERYSKFYEILKEGKMFKSDNEEKWICSHCGFFVKDEVPPKKCPVCSKEQGYYEIDCDCF